MRRSRFVITAARAAVGPVGCAAGEGPVSASAPDEEPSGGSVRQATFREVFAVGEFRPLFGTLPALHDRRRTRARGAHGAGLPAHRVPAAGRGHLRHRPPALAPRRPAALDPGRPPPPAPRPHRDRRRPGGAGRAAGDPRHPAADPARTAVPDRALRAPVRVRPLGADGRRARGRPVRGRHVARQHQPAARPGHRVRGRRCAGRRLQPVDGAARRRGDLRDLRGLALGAA